MQRLLIIFIALTIFIGCSLEKKRYSKGFYIRSKNIPSTSSAKTQDDRFSECDIIVLKGGAKIKGFVTEIGLDKITYVSCDDGETIAINRDYVDRIVYRNGIEKKIEPIINTSPEQVENKNQKNHPEKLAMASLLSLLGVLIPGIGFIGLIASPILAIMAIKRYNDLPMDQQRGRKNAVTALIVAIVVCVGYLVGISLLLLLFAGLI